MKRIIPAYTTLADILQDAVDKERDAAQFYVEAAERAEDPRLRDMLLDLARMEQDHETMLSRALDELRAGQTVTNGIMSSYGEEKDDD